MVNIQKEIDSHDLVQNAYVPDEFEVRVKDTLKALEDGKKKKKKEEIQVQKKIDGSEEEKFEVDSDENIETYFSYCQDTIGLFYLVTFNY